MGERGVTSSPVGSDREAPPTTSPESAFEILERHEEFGEDEGARLSVGGLAEIIRLLRPYWHGLRWMWPLIVGLGLVASLAESAGIGVILVLLSAMLRGNADTGLLEGEIPDRVINIILQWTGGGIGVLASLAVVFVLIRIISIVANDWATTLLQARIGHEVRIALFRSMLHMPFEASKNRSYGDMLTILNQHSWLVAEATDAVSHMAMTGSVALFMGVVLFLFSPQIALVALVGTVASSLMLQLLQRPAKAAGEQSSAAARLLSARAAHVLQSMRTVRAFSRVRSQAEAFQAESSRMRRASIQSDLLGSVVDAANQLVYIAMLAAIALVAVFEKLEFTTILAAVALLYRIQPYATQFEGHRLRLAGMLAPLRAVDELVRLAPPPDADQGTAPFDRLESGIRFDDVSFAYPGQPQPALNGVSFTIPAGGWTIIEGASGAGKSTIVNLLLRFYAPRSGRISVDGVPLDQLDIDAWPRRRHAQRALRQKADRCVAFADQRRTMGDHHPRVRLFSRCASVRRKLERAICLFRRHPRQDKEAVARRTRRVDRQAATAAHQRQRARRRPAQRGGDRSHRRVGGQIVDLEHAPGSRRRFGSAAPFGQQSPADQRQIHQPHSGNGDADRRHREKPERLAQFALAHRR